MATTVLITILDASGVFLKAYEQEQHTHLKTLVSHFDYWLCRECKGKDKVSLWYHDIQISPLHTPDTLAMTATTVLEARPSMICGRQTEYPHEGHPILHLYGCPLNVITPDGNISGMPFLSPGMAEVCNWTFDRFGMNETKDEDSAIATRRIELRREIEELKWKEVDLMRKIAVGQVYARHARNKWAVQENIRFAAEDLNCARLRVKELEKELKGDDDDGRRDSILLLE